MHACVDKIDDIVHTKKEFILKKSINLKLCIKKIYNPWVSLVCRVGAKGLFRYSSIISNVQPKQRVTHRESCV